MKNVFETYEYQGLHIKNRIVRAATNDYSGGINGEITQEQLNIYQTLAKNKIGLIITGNFYVSLDGKLDVTQNAIDDNFDKKGARQLVKTVHNEGAKIVFQISHAGKKTKINDLTAQFYENANSIPEETIYKIIRNFTLGAQRCKQVGADGVELHFGHGYLLGELLEERDQGLALADKILKNIRITLPNYPVLVKVNSDIKESLLRSFCLLCQKYKIWAIELSGSDFYQKGKNEHNYYKTSVQSVKKICSVPIIMTGGVRSFDDANIAIVSGAECVGMSRPFISEPDLIRKWPDRKSRCVSCSKCFYLYKKTGKRCIFDCK